MDKATRVTRRHCLFTMFSALIVVVCVCVGITINLTTVYDENFDHMGLRTFAMFTVNSNILCGATMMLALPYALDALRTHVFRLPKWVVVMVFTGVTAVALTFLVSLCILAPVKGFDLIFSGSRFFLHGVCPVLAVIAFCFFISERHLGFWETFIPLIPVFIYGCLYFIMVVLIGEENGGWNDFYGFATRVPVWIPAVGVMPVTFLIATVIRLIHNRSCDRRKKEEAEFFAETFKDADVRAIVGAMARLHRGSASGRNIVIPGRVISIMVENNDGDCTWEEACGIYLKEYLATNEVLDIKKLWI